MISHQKEKKILSFKKILTEILVTSNHISFKRTLVEKKSCSKFTCQQMEDFNKK